MTVVVVRHEGTLTASLYQVTGAHTSPLLVTSRGRVYLDDRVTRIELHTDVPPEPETTPSTSHTNGESL